MDDVKNKDPETIVVNVNENYGDSCLADSVNAVSSKSRKPEGYVEIYSVDEDGNKQKVGKSNLVLFHGREWIASRICGMDNPDIPQKADQFISWFGLGDRGCPANDPLTPTPPTNEMTALSREVPINATDLDCADYRLGSNFKHPLDGVTFQRDPANGNKWVIIKITTTIATNDANGYNLNEAGLYISESTDGGYNGDFDIFSIVTFPSIVKDTSRQLIFYWYLYC